MDQRAQVYSSGMQMRLASSVDMARYVIKDRPGQKMYGINTQLTELPLENAQPEDKINYLGAFQMSPGPASYSFATAPVASDTHLMNDYDGRVQHSAMNMDRELLSGVRDLALLSKSPAHDFYFLRSEL
jgi:hypothetical protein